MSGNPNQARRFRLLPNWRAVIRYAWSVKLIAAAALLSGAEVALPFIEHWLPVSRGTFAALSILATVAAFVARVVAQSKLSGGEA